MGDTPSWSGDRLGPYRVGRRYWDLGRHLGRLLEAHNVETGASALVVTQRKGDSWSPRTDWTVRVTSGALPPFISLEVEHAPDAATPALHELTLTFDHLEGVLGNIHESKDRANVMAHLTRKPRGAWPRRLLTHRSWLLAGVGVAVAAGLALLALWPRTPEPIETVQPPEVAGTTINEPVVFTDRQNPPPVIGYPMPAEPFKEQMKPPCLQGTEVEIRGGCWVLLAAKAPCPKSTAEFEGKCYMPVRKKDPLPQSVQP